MARSEGCSLRLSGALGTRTRLQYILPLTTWIGHSGTEPKQAYWANEAKE